MTGRRSHQVPLVILGAVGIYLAVALGLIVPGTKTGHAPEDPAIGFGRLPGGGQASPLRTYRSRDGTALGYRFHAAEGRTDTVLVLIHGSGYHGAYLQPLARAIAARGAAHVYTPDLRGHGPDPVHRGDVDRIGRLETDIQDLIAHLRARHGPGTRIVLGGHSSGGGLAIRHAGGDVGARVDGYLLLAPYIHHDAPTQRSVEAGWAQPAVPRIIGLDMLNAVGLRWFNGLPVIRFRMPARLRDGTETLRYSYRLLRSLHPRDDYGRDLAALDAPTLVLVGAADRAVVPDAYAPLFERHAPEARVRVLPEIGHLDIASAGTASTISTWLSDAIR